VQRIEKAINILWQISASRGKLSQTTDKNVFSGKMGPTGCTFTTTSL